MLYKSCIKNLFPGFFVCLLVFTAAPSTGAGTFVWSGSGTDNLASNPANWTGSVSPQNGDAVAFDSTSSMACIWDLNITVSSFNINPGYTGTVTIAADLTIDNGITWAGEGGDNLASNPANWSGGNTPQDGVNIDFDGMSDCLWDLDISPASLKMGSGFTGTVTLLRDLSISGYLSIEGGSLNLNDKALNTDGHLLIGPEGALYASSSTIRVNGDWTNMGTFDPGASTLILGGTDQTVYGDNAFYNLVKTSDSADNLYFEASRTQTVFNNLTLKGRAGTLLFLRSTVSGAFWSVDPAGSRYISYADIKDMNNANQAGVAADNSINSGNIINVYFDIDQCM